MARRAAGLTARRVETEKRPGLYADGGGLYLQVGEKGARSWIYRFQIEGTRRDMGLGSADLFTLAEARVKALAARKLVAEKVDPIKRRKDEEAAKALEAAKSTTFREAAEQYIEANRAGWRNRKHADQWSATLSAYAYPVLGGLPVAGVDTGLVCKVIEPIWTAKPETAGRVRGRIEAILDYAKARDLRSGENPARWKGHLDQILPAKGDVVKVRHHASLPHADLPAFWPRLGASDGMGARALELAILTATRTGEVLGATWAEIDMGAKVWTVPGERMKAGADHRIPLSEPALALLRKMSAIRTGDLVFAGPGGRALSNMTMTATLRRMKVEATAHGFRSTFRTWTAEQTKAPAEVAEAALAHTQGKLHAAYQRGDLFEKRADLMAAWGRFVEGKGAEVRRLRGRA